MKLTQRSTLTEADGRRLAVDMLAEMSALGFDELAIDGAQYRDGRPQSDMLVRYLRAAREDPKVEAGFLAVLQDVIGSAAEGSGHEDFDLLLQEGANG